jgi:hypothetical protein
VKAESTEPSALENKGPTNQQRKKERKNKEEKTETTASSQVDQPMVACHAPTKTALLGPRKLANPTLFLSFALDRVSLSLGPWRGFPGESHA